MAVIRIEIVDIAGVVSEDVGGILAKIPGNSIMERGELCLGFITTPRLEIVLA
jgi:hypothetical protein